MALSPLCLVQDLSGSWVATLDGVDVTNGDVVSIKLADPSEVTTWSLEITGLDELTTSPVLGNVDPVTHAVTNPNAIVTFTMPAGADARAVLFKSIGASPGVSATTTFAIYTPTGAGHRVGALGEELEGSHTHGWLLKINPLIRAVGTMSGGGGSGGGGDVCQLVPGVAGRQGTLSTGFDGIGAVYYNPANFTIPTGKTTRSVVLRAFLESTSGIVATLQLYDLVAHATVTGSVLQTAVGAPTMLTSGNLDSVFQSPIQMEVQLKLATNASGNERATCKLAWLEVTFS